VARKNNLITDNIDDKKRKVSTKDWQKIKKIFSFAYPYRLYLIIGMFFLVVSTITSLTIPILSGKFLDVATGKQTILFKNIADVAVIFAVVLATQAFLSFFRIYLFSQASERAMSDIRLAVYDKILHLPITFFEQKRVGDLNSRLTSDVAQLQDALSFNMAEFFRQIMTILIGTTYLFVQSTRLTLVMICTFPVLMIVAVFFGKYIRKLAKKSQDSLAEANIIVEETFQAIHTVKSFANESLEIGRYQKSLNVVTQSAIKVATYRGFFVSFVILLLFGGLMGVLGYGATLVENGQMSVGELTTFIIFSAFIGGSVGGTSELYGQLQKTIGASERILEILEETAEYTPKNIEKLVENQENPSKKPKIVGNIQFQNVNFAYPTRKDIEILKGFELNIKAGEKIAVVGHSGVGKSTLVQLLGRYYPLSSGKILVENENLEDLDLKYLRQNIGVVPQEVLLFGGTIKENILYGKPNATDQEIMEASQKANAWDFIQGFPEKLETLVGERGIKLSGGQRQRIAIARAILKNPSILVLDEATSSLDAESEKAVQEALERLMENRTTIIIAHRLATIRNADRIAVLDKGIIKEIGTHEELTKIPDGIYQNLVRLNAVQFVE
jgi:ATP-binding cassette, subfamily B, bacterial